MSTPRITHLSEPPVVGRWYLVPTVAHPWHTDRPTPLPVFLPKHDDARFFNVAEPHYHPDPRFISSRLWNALRDTSWDWSASDDAAFRQCQRRIVARWKHGAGANDLPPIVWRRRMCQRSEIAYQYSKAPQVQELQAHYAGQNCREARTGWLCPHQRFPLGSIAPDAHGVITCPLHGLRLRAADGLVLPLPPPLTAEPKAAA